MSSTIHSDRFLVVWTKQHVRLRNNNFRDTWPAFEFQSGQLEPTRIADPAIGYLLLFFESLNDFDGGFFLFRNNYVSQQFAIPYGVRSAGIVFLYNHVGIHVHRGIFFFFFFFLSEIVPKIWLAFESKYTGCGGEREVMRGITRTCRL